MKSASAEIPRRHPKRCTRYREREEKKKKKSKKARVGRLHSVTLYDDVAEVQSSDIMSAFSLSASFVAPVRVSGAVQQRRGAWVDVCVEAHRLAGEHDEKKNERGRNWN